jgi:alginate O-acetyltransferase complex protein AlgI
MLFNTPQFVLFFLITVALYFSIPNRYRWMLLLAASYYFYMCWKVEYILILIGFTLVNYFTGIRMSKIPDKEGRKSFLWLSLIANLGALFCFKYFNFFSRTVTEAFHAWNIFYNVPVFNVLLPVGISFYTFQMLSYTIDVYNGRVLAERHPGIFALYTAFWPQLLAGPIARTNHLLPQFRRSCPFEYQRVTDGLRLMLWGLFKKVVIADHLATYVNRVYNHVGDYQGLPLMVATGFYAVQIYCDFSGYTDVARGAARVMGYDLMENFRRPYFAKSIRQFWHRWHISLSTWFRDYVYIPLGGNRVVKWRWYYNLFLTFLASGLWHGANWTFVIWGALHGCYLILENVSRNFQSRLADKLFPDKQSFLNKAVQVSITMGLVCFAWVFFRANTVGDAFSVIGNMFLIDPREVGIAVVGSHSFLFYCLLVLILVAVEMKERTVQIYEFVARMPLLARWSVYTAAFWAIAVSTVFSVRQEFIYFQF